MRKLLLLLYIVAAGLLLTGCGEHLFSSRRDMERLRPVQTLGIDGTEDGVRLSVSAGAGPDARPLVLSAAAGGIEPAITVLQDYSPEDELFYAHIRYLLLGADGASACFLPLLDWVERSPALGLNTPLLIVKGRAETAVTGASGEMTDVTRRLASLQREEQSRGRHIFTLREIAASLLERGGALCLAVEIAPGEDVVRAADDGGDALLPAGYGVLRPGQAPVWLTEEESLGAELLLDGLAGARVTVADCAMEVLRGRARVRGEWSEGSLTGLTVTGTLTAGILESGGTAPPAREALENTLAAAARGWIEAVLRRSQALRCDFLDLERGAAEPVFRTGRAAAAWEDRFSDLPVTIDLTARIDRSYDLAEE